MSDKQKLVRSHSRFKREELPDDVRATIDKYVPRIVEGIITDITGTHTLHEVMNLNDFNRWNVPDIAKIALYAKESTMGVWFIPAGVIIYGDTPRSIISPTGEKLYMGRTPAVSFPYTAFGFNTEDIRELLSVTIEISMLLPINHKEVTLDPDTSKSKNVPRVPKQHRIVFSSSELESLRAMVTL